MSSANPRAEPTATEQPSNFPPPPAAAGPSLMAGPWLLAGAGIASAAIVWFAADRYYPFFVAVHEGTARTPNPGEMERFARYQYLNPLVLLAIAGAAQAVALALVEGLTRRSLRFALLGVVSGLLLGGAFGAAAGCSAQFVFDLPLHRLIDMGKTMIVQATCWGIAGLGIGLGFALPSWQRRAVAAGAVGASVGGLLAAFLYGPAAALMFRLANTEMLVPHSSFERLAWLTTAAALMGLIAGGLGRPRPAKRASDEAATAS